MKLWHALAEIEYHVFRDPRFTQPTRFGEFVRIPDFATRYDANQLVDARCAREEVDELLAEFETLYPPDIGYRKLTAHRPKAVEALTDALISRGFSPQWCRMATFGREPRRRPNSDLKVRAVAFDHPDLDVIAGDRDGRETGLGLHRSQAERVGGEWLVGYLDGEPAGCAGWFITPQNIARYRRIDTRPAFRNRGVATTLVRYVQDHPTVRAARALCLGCGEDGPWGLYEGLGFVERGRAWEFLKRPA